MKTWPQRLRELPLDRLQARIEVQKKDLEIVRRDLETMERILHERTKDA